MWVGARADVLATNIHHLLLFVHVGAGAVAALQAFKREVGDLSNKLSNWVDDDPCGSLWTGVHCNGTVHIKELRLLNMGFTGSLSRELGNLRELVVLDVMWNSITGSIPAEIGNLSNLRLLLLNGNKLSGMLPPELGNLSKLNRLQVDQNNLSGPVPANFQFLNQAKHFHMNNNSLNGSIPIELGRLENLIHLLLDNNKLSGVLPAELSNILTLVILQLDNNQFQGSIPSSYSNLVNLKKMSLRNCNLSGTIFDLTPINTLAYLDLSHNNLIGTIPSQSISQFMSTIDLSFNELYGEVPTVYYQLPDLEVLMLRENSFDGNVRADLIRHSFFSSAESKFVLDFQNNNFTGFDNGAAVSVHNITFRLFGNPVCNGKSSIPMNACIDYNGDVMDIFDLQTATTLAPLSGCSCDGSHNQEPIYGLIPLGQCHCAYPLSVQYRLKSPSFVNFPPYEKGLQNHLALGLHMYDYQVAMSEYKWEPGPRLAMTVKLFPTTDTSQFRLDDVSRIYDTFVTWDFSDNFTYGPYELIAFTIGYPYNEESTGSQKPLSRGAVAGIVVGTVAVTSIFVVVVIFVVLKQRRPSSSTLRPGKPKARHRERVNVAGVRRFTYDEIAKATDNFDILRQIGKGGYGNVYKAVLDDGLLVAVKRAEEGSLQGTKEFITEIELLSRIHHRNLVSLIGYCDDEGEQLLVYEFMANGSLRDHLNSDSKVPLSFANRIQVALGAAKGILYLHTEANPPIYHRDIKASNILLDDKRRAKVADFGLSKLATAPNLEGDPGGGIWTAVRGTPGYLDPEYFITHTFTDKSDVYSFGVVLLELLTGKQPISNGKNLVREVKLVDEAGNLLSFVDIRMGPCPSECVERLGQLGILCCKDDMKSRPSMAQVVRELEAIWRLTPVSDEVDFIMDKTLTATKELSTHEFTDPSVSSGTSRTDLISGASLSVLPR